MSEEYEATPGEGKGYSGETDAIPTGNGERYAVNRIANARTTGLPEALIITRGAAEGRAYFRPGSDRLRQLYREGPSTTYKTVRSEGLETALVAATPDQIP